MDPVQIIFLLSVVIVLFTTIRRQIWLIFDPSLIKNSDVLNGWSLSLIGDVMRALGQNPTESEVKKLVHEHQASERVSFEIFLPILQAICGKRSTDTTEDFVEGLRHFDKDGNGFISSAELRHLLTTLGERLNDEEVFFLLSCKNGNVVHSNFSMM